MTDLVERLKELHADIREAQIEHLEWSTIDGRQDFLTEAATEIERLQAENEQHQDIRDDMETLLKMIAEHLGVPDEPHQTWQERLLEALKEHTLIRKP